MAHSWNRTWGFLAGIIVLFSGMRSLAIDMTEPANDDQATATALTAGVPDTHSIYSNDEDWFSFTLASNAAVRVVTYGSPERFGDSVDTYMELTDAAGTLPATIAESDDGATDQFAAINADLAAGTYKVRITHGGNGSEGAYVILVKTLPRVDADVAVDTGLTPTAANYGDTVNVYVDLTLNAGDAIPDNDEVTVNIRIYDDKDPTPWAPTTAYLVNDYVTYNGNTYQCATTHVSSSDFWTDYGNGNWNDVQIEDGYTAQYTLTKADITTLNGGALNNLAIPVTLLYMDNPFSPLFEVNMDVNATVQFTQSYNIGVDVDQADNHLFINGYELTVPDASAPNVFYDQAVNLSVSIAPVFGTIPTGALTMSNAWLTGLGDIRYTILDQAAVDALNLGSTIQSTITVAPGQLAPGVQYAVASASTATAGIPLSFFVNPPSTLQQGSTVLGTDLVRIDGNVSGQGYIQASPSVDFTAMGVTVGMTVTIANTPNRLHDGLYTIASVSATGIYTTTRLNTGTSIVAPDLNIVEVNFFRVRDLRVISASFTSPIPTDTLQQATIQISKATGSADLEVGDEITVNVLYDYDQTGGFDYKVIGSTTVSDIAALNAGTIQVDVPFTVPSVDAFNNPISSMNLRAEVQYIHDMNPANDTNDSSYGSWAAGPTLSILDIAGPATVNIGSNEPVMVKVTVSTDAPLPKNAELSLDLELADSTNGTIYVVNRQLSGPEIVGLGTDPLNVFITFDPGDSNLSTSNVGVWDAGWACDAGIQYEDTNTSNIIQIDMAYQENGSPVTVENTVTSVDLEVLDISATSVASPADPINVEVTFGLADTAVLLPENTIVGLVISFAGPDKDGQDEFIPLTLNDIRRINAGEYITASTILMGDGLSGVSQIIAYLSILEGNARDANPDNNWMSKDIDFQTDLDIYPDLFVDALPASVTPGQNLSIRVRIRKTGTDNVSTLLRPILMIASDFDSGAPGFFLIGGMNQQRMLSVDEVVELNATGEVTVTVTGEVIAAGLSGFSLPVYAQLMMVPNDTNELNNRLLGGNVLVNNGADVAIESAAFNPVDNAPMGSVVYVDISLSKSGGDLSLETPFKISIKEIGAWDELTSYTLTDAEITALNTTGSVMVSVPVTLDYTMMPTIQLQAELQVWTDTNYMNNSAQTGMLVITQGTDLMVDSVTAPGTLTAGQQANFTVDISIDPLMAAVPSDADVSVSIKVQGDSDFLYLAAPYDLSATDIAVLNGGATLTLTLPGTAGPDMDGKNLIAEVQFDGDANGNNDILIGSALTVVGAGTDLAVDIVSGPTAVIKGQPYTARIRVSYVSGEDVNSAADIVPMMTFMRENDESSIESYIALTTAQIADLINTGYVELDISMSWTDIESTITTSFDDQVWFAVIQLNYPADTNLDNNGIFYIATVKLFDNQFVVPTTGQNVEIGSTLTVDWNTGQVLGEPVRLEVSRNGAAGPWTLINGLILGVSEYNWSVSGPTTNSAMFRLGNLNADTYVYSDPFNIVPATSSYIIVTQPNGDETYAIDGTMRIEWDTNISGAIMTIDVSDDNFATFDTLMVTDSTTIDLGATDYIVNAADFSNVTLPSDQVKLKITVLGESDASDGLFSISSGPATVLSATPGSLVFTAATGSVTPVNDTVILQTSAGEGSVFWTSSLSASGGDWLNIDMNTGLLNSGSQQTVTLTVDPTGLAVGSYSGAVTFSAAGQTDVVVNVTLNIVGVEVVYPNGGEPLSGVVTLRWRYLNPTAWTDSTVDVNLLNGGVFDSIIASGVSLSVTQTVFDTTTVSDGSAYRIQVVGTATDRSDAVFLIDNTPPVLTVSSPSPAHLATNVSQDPVLTATLSATDATAGMDPLPFRFMVSGDAGFSSVLYDSGWMAATAYDIPVTLAGNTTYYWKIIARDVIGHEDESSVMQFTTITDATPPTVLSSNPTDGAVDVSVTAVITITFSEPMNTALSESAITYSGLAPADVSYSWTTGNTVLAITPTAALNLSTSYTVTVGVGAEDVAGNSLSSSFVFTFTTVADITPPTVTSSNPADGAMNVAINQTIQITFSEPMDTVATNAALSIVNLAATQITLTWSAGDTVLTITPNSDLTEATSYTITISTGAADANGVNLTAQINIQFTTTSGAGTTNVTSSICSLVSVRTVGGDASWIVGLLSLLIIVALRRKS